MLKEVNITALGEHMAIAKMEDPDTKLQAANDNLQQFAPFTPPGDNL